MGQIQTITQGQKRILDRVSKNKYFGENFYFTGGTALSYFYLSHRFSDDLDFFTDKPFDREVVFNLISIWSKEDKFTFSSRFIEVVYRFDLLFNNKQHFKVDFSYYPYKQISKGKSYNLLAIDSLTDIATNKLLTINQRNDIKDFVDLYFLLKKNFNIWELIDNREAKFKHKVDILLLAEDLLKIEEFPTLPKMAKPLTLKTLKNYFRQLAISLGKQAVTK